MVLEIFTTYMSLCSPKKVKELLQKYGLSPNRNLGQNFLIDGNVLEKIIKACEIQEDDVILEVGAGLGTLTQELVKKARKVLAVEVDKGLFRILKENLKNLKNVEVINEDILDFQIEKYIKENYRIIANLPYQISSPFLEKFLLSNRRGGDVTLPSRLDLLVQKEFAERLYAKPPRMNKLAVFVQFFTDPKIVFQVSPNSFYPTSEVWSSFIKMEFKKRPMVSEKDFLLIVKMGFSNPRKQIGNNLSGGLQIEKDIVRKKLKEIKIDFRRRAESLSMGEWVRLYNVFK